ncbi:preprotein translocase subunit SecA [compost metagenome]
MQFQHDAAPALDQPLEAEEFEAESGQAATVTALRQEPKVGRNEPCPCGSGKKYKHCHGQVS